MRKLNFPGVVRKLMRIRIQSQINMTLKSTFMPLCFTVFLWDICGKNSLWFPLEGALKLRKAVKLLLTLVD